MRDLARGAPIRPGLNISGQTTWSRYGQQMASVGWLLRTTADGGHLGLAYDVTMGGERVSKDYLVPLVTTEQPAGGLRFWFWCQRGNVMCSTLYLMPGSTVFASRAALGRVSYRTQRISTRDRALEKAQRIRASLGGSVSLFDPFPERPAGMWTRTYERKRARAQAAADLSLSLLAQRLGGFGGLGA